LAHEAEQNEEEKDQYFGLSLRELVHTYKWQTLVLFKCLLLQPKVSLKEMMDRSGDQDCPRLTARDRCYFSAHIARKYARYNFRSCHSYPVLYEICKTAPHHISTDMDGQYDLRTV
jgi:hypothetical protein